VARKITEVAQSGVRDSIEICRLALAQIEIFHSNETKVPLELNPIGTQYVAVSPERALGSPISKMSM
jgi:hypothetical protein